MMEENLMFQGPGVVDGESRCGGKLQAREHPQF